MNEEKKYINLKTWDEDECKQVTNYATELLAKTQLFRQTLLIPLEPYDEKISSHIIAFCTKIIKTGEFNYYNLHDRDISTIDFPRELYMQLINYKIWLDKLIDKISSITAICLFN